MHDTIIQRWYRQYFQINLTLCELCRLQHPGPSSFSKVHISEYNNRGNSKAPKYREPELLLYGPGWWLLYHRTTGSILLFLAQRHPSCTLATLTFSFSCVLSLSLLMYMLHVAFYVVLPALRLCGPGRERNMALVCLS